MVNLKRATVRLNSWYKCEEWKSDIFEHSQEQDTLTWVMIERFSILVHSDITMSLNMEVGMRARWILNVFMSRLIT